VNRRFKRELLWTNYILIGAFVVMLTAANLYYGPTAATLAHTLPVIAVLLIAMIIKIRRIGKMDKELDERRQLITYRAVNNGFYFMLLAVFWFYTKELAASGSVSLRTIIELLAGVTGYIGSLLVFRKVY